MPMIVPAFRPVGAFLRRRRVTLAILLVASATLFACQPSIQEVRPVSPLVAPTVTPEERGLAIMGVDFDPPLEAGQFLTNGGITLLVAVENHGRQVEPTARVTARLYDPRAGRSVDLANETVTVRGLAPGELRVVRFTQVSNLPVRNRYKLAVEISPAPGERERADNVRTYDIVLQPTP